MFSVCCVSDLCSVGAHMLCLWSKFEKDCRPLLSGRSLGVACRSSAKTECSFLGTESEDSKRLWEEDLCVDIYIISDHKLCPSLNQSLNLSLCLKRTCIDAMWQRCGSPMSPHTTRQMVVCFTVHLHPDWFIYLFVLVPSLFCLDSKLFRAILAVRVTIIAICWISLLTLSVHCFYSFL